MAARNHGKSYENMIPNTKITSCLLRGTAKKQGNVAQPTSEFQHLAKHPSYAQAQEMESFAKGVGNFFGLWETLQLFSPNIIHYYICAYTTQIESFHVVSGMQTQKWWAVLAGIASMTT